MVDTAAHLLDRVFPEVPVRQWVLSLPFSVDILACPRCGGRMRILGAIHPPDAIRKILSCLGLPSRPPPIAPAILATADHEISS